jgi:hypothetical protein
MQAAARPSPRGASGGGDAAQAGSAYRQRGAKRQPAGIASGGGT